MNELMKRCLAEVNKRSAFTLGAIFLCAGAHACDYSEKSAKQNEAAATAAFVGNVTAVRKVSGGLAAQFNIHKSSKGWIFEPATAEIFAPSGTCGINFEVGQLWVVFAKGRPLETSYPYGSFLVTAKNPPSKSMVTELFGQKID